MKEYTKLYERVRSHLLEVQNEDTQNILKISEEHVVKEINKYLNTSYHERLDLEYFIKVPFIKSYEHSKLLEKTLNQKGLKCISKYTPHYYAADRAEKYEIII